MFLFLGFQSTLLMMFFLFFFDGIYFYDVFENVLNHGFKGKKGFGLSMLRNKDLTVLLDVISTKSDSSGCLSSIKDFAEIKYSNNI